MDKNLLVHGIWGAVALAAFAFGSLRSGRNAAADGDAGQVAETSAPTLALSEYKAGKRSVSALGLSGSTSGESDAKRGLMSLRRPLSDDEIEELGRQFAKDNNPISRRLAFTRLLEGLTPENGLAIREIVKNLGSDSAEFRDFHYAWGAVGGADAVLNGAETRERDMATTLAGWASADAGAAMAWFDSLPEGKGYDRNGLKIGLVNGLADSDPEGATRFVYDLANAGDKLADGMLAIVSSKMLRSFGPEESARWSENLPEGALRASAMDRVANAYVARDPQAAAAWAERFANEPYSARVIEEVGDEWAERDPVAAVNWLESLDSGDGKSQGLGSAFGEWVRRDPMAASQYLVTMAPSPERDSAIGGFASRLAYEDPQAAIAWAGQIADTGSRERTLVRAGQAMYRRDPNGTRTWLASSGLSATAQEQVRNPPRRR